MRSCRLNFAFWFFTALLFLILLFSPFKELIEDVSAGDNNYLNAGNDVFLIGALDNYYDLAFSNISSLKMNLWHKYNNDTVINDRRYPRGFSYDDLIQLPLSVYSPALNERISKNISGGLYCWLQRPKIEWLCYGQKSEYQCESDIMPDDNTWFYSFSSHYTGRDISDGNSRVRYCSISGNDKAGWIFRKLKANNEQCSANNFENAWMDDSQCSWYINPRMKIDKKYANDTRNSENKVCTIEIVNSSGFLLKAFDLRVKNFLDINGFYDGSYIEDYRIYPGEDSLIIKGDWGSVGPWSSRGNDTSDVNIPGVCKADIRAYWQANCDIWIDYIKVENDISRNLFSGKCDSWIKEEAEYSKSNPSILKFYMELFRFNNIPCIEYVNKKLKSYNSGADVIADFYWAYYTSHLPWGYAINGKWSQNTYLNADNIIKNYIKKADISSFLIETYPLTASNNFPPTPNFSKIPETLPKIKGEGILATPVSSDEYDKWLQYQFDYSIYPNSPGSDVVFQWKDPGYFRWNLSLANEISRKTGINWIDLAQAHLWWKPGGEVRREPTNEELELMANLAISYGAKGLVYFYWNGFGEINDNNPYGRGFCEDYSGSPRYLNVYGENKWEKFSELLPDISAIGPLLMSFDNKFTSSYAYYMEADRNSLRHNTCLNIIYTYAVSTGDPGNPSGIPDADSNTYTQAAVFKQQGSESDNYFMIINRRCSPLNGNGNDGRRFIAIGFDPASSEFNGSDKWLITDIKTNTVAARYNKTNPAPVVLGLFRPAEAKIYRLTPEQ